jgi:NADH-quinone oxidoreductase subunit L
MIARSNILYSLAPFSQAVVAIVGLVTAVFAATIALKQNDIKKVLAYSTISQLGYMFLGLGVGAYTAAVFHVMTHAFFKALLFLAAGSVIHAVHEQDIRKMGGLKKHLPVTHATFLLACFAIAGIPPFAGFFSKDAILAAAFESNKIYWIIGVLGSLLTAFYMFRLYATTFLGSFRGTSDQQSHLHESPAAITIPLIILAILSVAGGWIGIPEAILKNGDPLSSFLAPIFEESTKLKAAAIADHNQDLLLMGVTAVLALVVGLIAWMRFSKKPELQEATGFGKILANKWYVDEFYDAIIVKPIQALAKFLNNFIEKDVIDWIINGIGKIVNYTSRQVRLVQSGQVGSYVLLMVLSILVFFVVQFFVKK